MDELKITQQAGVINTNLDAIEAEIKEQMADYKDYLVTEDSIKSDKKVLADLRKLEKELNEARIATKKKWNEPFELFENRCKEVIALVHEPIDLINSQIKLFDEEKKIQKQKHIEELYAENIQGLERFLPFEKVISENPKWLNASTKDQDVLFDLNGMVLKIKNDLDAIKALNSEIEEDCINTYANSGNNLSMAIQRNSQYLSDKQKVVEQAKKTEEPVTEKVEEKSPIKQLDNLAQMVRTVKVTLSYSDWQSVKETLEFMNIKYQVEGE